MFCKPMLFCAGHDDDAARVYQNTAFLRSFPHKLRVLPGIEKCLAILIHKPGVPGLPAGHEQGIIQRMAEDLSIPAPLLSTGEAFILLLAVGGGDTPYGPFSARPCQVIS
jgi:hypothetical protein